MTSRFCRNDVCLRGNVLTNPEYNHKFADREFYQFFISVKRISGIDDVIPVTVSKEILDEVNIKVGDNIAVSGEYRSYNNYKKLELYVYAKKITVYEEENFYNTVKLSGFVCKKGDIRQTPKGKVIMDVFLAINRFNSKSAYIPCIIWNVTEEEHRNLNVGDKVCITGRIQSREYVKVYEDETTETKIAYEVSVKEYKKE